MQTDNNNNNNNFCSKIQCELLLKACSTNLLMDGLEEFDTARSQCAVFAQRPSSQFQHLHSCSWLTRSCFSLIYMCICKPHTMPLGNSWKFHVHRATNAGQPNASFEVGCSHPRSHRDTEYCYSTTRRA